MSHRNSLLDAYVVILTQGMKETKGQGHLKRPLARLDEMSALIFVKA